MFSHATDSKGSIRVFATANPFQIFPVMTLSGHGMRLRGSPACEADFAEGCRAVFPRAFDTSFALFQESNAAHRTSNERKNR
ncbi:hypothetical protein [Paraburkholderia kururiensis]|uniref:hypothetical protein n=1 Tax=Paraburkholderia kururiensis TaxID=984307 RepID=UPI000F880A27|nr:hypothetical protein [Paraburkholderia kururiensis]